MARPGGTHRYGWACPGAAPPMPLKQTHVALALLAACLVLLASRGCLFPTRMVAPAPPTPAERPDELTVYYHERRPYYYAAEGRVTGIVLDRAVAGLQLAGIPFRLAALPPAQQLHRMREGGEFAAGIGWIANAERRRFAHFSQPVYQDGPFVALARADDARFRDGLRLEDLLAQPELTLLVKDAYSYGPQVDALLARLQPRRLSTPAPNDAMLRMLHEGRADYFLLADEEADALVETADDGKNYRVAHLAGAPRGVVRHLMFNRRVPEALVARFNAALATLPPAEPARTP
jgi:polar amino acid transport system substrate-binding protein